MRRCPSCYHKWHDKYGFDECPKCLVQLSYAAEQQTLVFSTAKNMEPSWSQTAAQKLHRWSNSLRDTVHSGRTPRHNPTIPPRSPNAKFHIGGFAHTCQLDHTPPSTPTKQRRATTPLVSPVSDSTIGTTFDDAGSPLPTAYVRTIDPMAKAVADAQSARAGAEAAKATAEAALPEVDRLRKLLLHQGVGRMELARALADARAARKEAEAAHATAAKAVAEVGRLRKLLHEQGVVAIS